MYGSRRGSCSSSISSRGGSSSSSSQYRQQQQQQQQWQLPQQQQQQQPQGQHLFAFNPPLTAGSRDEAAVKGMMHDVLKASTNPGLYCRDFFVMGCSRGNCRMKHSKKDSPEVKAMLSSFKQAIGNAYAITV